VVSRIELTGAGIIVYQNEDGDVLDIQADIIGPVETPYYGGIFRCKLVLESGFPASPPKGFFLTKIFHPNVATPSGDICVNTLKRDWNPAQWSLKHIFEVIKCLLIVPFPESSLNEEAGRQFMEDYDAFCNHARVYTEVHARPNAAQKALIEERSQKEAQKSATETQKPVAVKQPELIITLKPQNQPELEENKEGWRPKADELMDQGENSVPTSGLPAGSVSYIAKPE